MAGKQLSEFEKDQILSYSDYGISFRDITNIYYYIYIYYIYIYIYI